MTITSSPQYSKTIKQVIIPIANNTKLSKVLLTIQRLTNIPIANLTQDFKADDGEVYSCYDKNNRKLFLVGLGKNPSFSSIVNSCKIFSFKNKEKFEKKIGISFLQKNIATKKTEAFSWIEATINGILLGQYDIGLYKTTKSTIHPLSQAGAKLQVFVDKPLMSISKEAIKKAQATAETQLRIFDLVNGPGNKVKPETLANWAKASGKKHGYKVKALNKKQIEKLGLDALLAVNRGSEYPPSFIIMEYRPNNKKKYPKIGIVGKGVTFDTGGLSIKGANNMHYMKSDMGGAAAVLGAMELTAKLKLPIHLIGIVPTTDNCVDALAVKPGDVISSYSGKSIEIIDTDAEGRLILADGLAYMQKHFQPEIMINLATLTGSCVRTLGYHAGGLFTKNDRLANDLYTTGQKTGEALWRLPMWDVYHEDMESDVADIKNFSGKPLAGAITAGKFLEAFTADHPSWAHLDIAGVAFGNSGLSAQKSATGFGVNLLVNFFYSKIN